MKILLCFTFLTALLLPFAEAASVRRLDDAIPAPVPSLFPPSFVFPTILGTEDPTMAPTELPTGAPTELPTSVPTVAPVTTAPVSFPPTAAPSTTPVSVPSVAPVTTAPESTVGPTATLNVNTTIGPVVNSTEAPTQAPAPDSTSLPTQSPAPNSTSLPTEAPNSTSLPTQAPNSTSLPTQAPTQNSTSLPTQAPTQNPTSLPTQAPTNTVPTLAPTTSPTRDGISVQETFEGVVHVFDGMDGPLGEAASREWANLTETFMEDFYAGGRRRLQFDRDDLRGFRAEISGINQRFPADSEQLTMIYDLTVSYVRFDEKARNADRVATLPFRVSNAAYVDLMKENLAPFENLRSANTPLIVLEEPTPSPMGPGGGNDVGSDDDDGIGAGSVVAIVLLVCLVAAVAGYFWYSQYYLKTGTAIPPSPPPPEASKNDFEEKDANSSLGLDMMSELDTRSRDDEPSYQEKDQASVAFSYSEIAPGKAQASSVASVSTDTSAGAPYAESDINIEEDQFVVYAPAGKLGLVVDNPDEGPPMIHAIKGDSVLADQVNVGDRLVGVDEVDVRTLSPVKVSKLISKRSANPLRKLTLTRTKIDMDEYTEGQSSYASRATDMDTNALYTSSDDETSHVGSMSRLSFGDEMRSRLSGGRSVDTGSNDGSIDPGSKKDP